MAHGAYTELCFRNSAMGIIAGCEKNIMIA